MQIPSKKLYRDISLERLSSPDRLDELMHITTPQGWLILVVIGLGLVGIVAWGILGELTTTVNSGGTLVITDNDSDNDTIQAEFTMDISDAQVLSVGGEVEISLATVATDAAGFVRGTIREINEISSTDSQVMVTVVVDLPAADTPTGLEWTVGDGPDITLYNGATVTGNFIIEREHPIERIFPGIGS